MPVICAPSAPASLNWLIRLEIIGCNDAVIGVNTLNKFWEIFCKSFSAIAERIFSLLDERVVRVLRDDMEILEKEGITDAEIAKARKTVLDELNEAQKELGQGE